MAESKFIVVLPKGHIKTKKYNVIGTHYISVLV
jgi:hypothetical protein